MSKSHIYPHLGSELALAYIISLTQRHYPSRGDYDYLIDPIVMPFLA